MKDVARSADGIPVHFEVEGAGEPALVFVHGWSCDRTYWSPQIDHFAASHEVVAVDLAGHGESGGGRRDWTMPAFGGDVVAVIEKLGLRQVVLIGHSMGGDVIVEVALALPERITGLVWVDTYRTLGGVDTPEETERFVRPFRQDFRTAVEVFVRPMFVPSSDPQLVERVVADMSAAPPEAAVVMLAHAVMNDDPLLAALPRLQAPVVAINSDYQPNDIEALRRRGVEAVLMSGVGHFVMLEDPEAFNRLLGQAVGDFIQ